MIDLKENFRDWLFNQGLSIKTPSGKPSTVYDYLTKINRVCQQEGYRSWEELAVNLFTLINDYQGKYKTALIKYNEYLFDAQLSRDLSYKRYQNILCIFSFETGKIKINENKELFTPGEAASILRVSERTLARWRQYHRGPKYRKNNGNGKITYPKQCLEDYINETLLKI